MRRMFWVLATLGLILMFSGLAAEACTSFGKCSGEVLYGANFDYPDTELRFSIDRGKSGRVFALMFKADEDYWGSAAMNDKGLFMVCQMQYPPQPNQVKLGRDEMYIGASFGLVWEYQRIQQVKDYLQKKRLVQGPVTVHQLVGDGNGDACIVEAGATKNEIIPRQGPFIVMSNFTNADFVGQPYTAITGVGADRYQKAYEYIQKNLDRFSVATGLETLALTQQSAGGYPTQSSMVLDPKKGEIYIVLKRDFSKVWKVSINKGTIESFKGFAKPVTLKLTAKGILASELLKLSADKAAEVQKTTR